MDHSHHTVAALPVFELWALTGAIAFLIMAYTARRVWKVNRSGRKVIMPLAFPHIVMMMLDYPAMALWMLGGTGWGAVAVNLAHIGVAWLQARRADEF